MAEAILTAKKLSKNFGGLAAVSNLDLEVRENEIVGLIGPNGAGKTTTFNLLTGFDVPGHGQIFFEGKSLIGLHPFKICKLGLTRTFQQAKPMFGMTILENVTIGALNRINKLKEAVSYSKEIIRFIGLEQYQDVLTENLPLGYRKILEIAKCLATKPKLLLLDEVMAGLNPFEIDMILERIKSIRNQGVSILLIEHVIEAVMSLSDRVIVLNYGEKICEGSARDVMKDHKVVEAYLGDDFAFAEN